MLRRAAPYLLDFTAAWAACFVGYVLMTLLLGNYPRTGRGWLSVTVICGFVGLAFALRFYLRSFLPRRDMESA